MSLSVVWACGVTSGSATALGATLGFGRGRWRSPRSWRRWRRCSTLGLLQHLLGALDRLGHVLHAVVVQLHLEARHVLVLVEVALRGVQAKQRVGEAGKWIIVEIEQAKVVVCGAVAAVALQGALVGGFGLADVGIAVGAAGGVVRGAAAICRAELGQGDDVASAELIDQALERRQRLRVLAVLQLMDAQVDERAGMVGVELDGLLER